GKTICTLPNVDSVFNIPNTILRCTPDTKFLILEMSVEYLGEMDFYLWLAKPDIGVVTNVFPTHLQFFDDEKGVAKEKGKLVSNLSSNGFAILNSNNIHTKNMAKITKARVIYFDVNEDPITTNSNAARKVAEIFKVPENLITKGLKNYENPKHRLFQFKHKSGSYILDDTYNSNPEATLSTLKVFNKLAKGNKKIAVLGDMLELGKLEEREHRRVGREVLKLKFDVVIGVGKLSRYLIDEVNNSNCKTYNVDSQEEVLPILLPLLSKNTYVLIKGSRSIGLDKVIDKLL
ncbi:MAG: UDP-N-acetylmuramoyl-tripeptide--D-alanyl-D-alanine ligase, partial [Candidatus Woesebacteria bacterium]|nr:UDP-N-acetylmuramoyl-tripeptide--D-alanyl-D-alanine ligase [Candidatus Woesebacteria bacterium]